MTCRWSSFPCVFTWSSFCVCLCPNLSFLYKDQSYKIRAHLVISFKLTISSKALSPGTATFCDVGGQDFHIRISGGTQLILNTMSVIFRRAGNLKAVPHSSDNPHRNSIFISYPNARFTGLPELLRTVFSSMSCLCGIRDVSWNIPLKDCNITKLEAIMSPDPPLLP